MLQDPPPHEGFGFLTQIVLTCSGAACSSQVSLDRHSSGGVRAGLAIRAAAEAAATAAVAAAQASGLGRGTARPRPRSASGPKNAGSAGSGEGGGREEGTSRGLGRGRWWCWGLGDWCEKGVATAAATEGGRDGGAGEAGVE